jgi:hypothetical protein
MALSILNIGLNSSIRLFSKLVGEEDSRIQGVKGSSECKRLDTDDINICVFSALTP